MHGAYNVRFLTELLMHSVSVLLAVVTCKTADMLPHVERQLLQLNKKPHTSVIMSNS
jgi:hypothetical protein